MPRVSKKALEQAKTRIEEVRAAAQRETRTQVRLLQEQQIRLLEHTVSLMTEILDLRAKRRAVEKAAKAKGIPLKELYRPIPTEKSADASPVRRR